MSLGTLGASLLGNIWTGTGINTAEGAISKRQSRGIVRAGYGNKNGPKATTKSKMDY